MATNLFRTSKKLITALNSKGDNLTMSSKEFIGTEGRPHKMYIISRATWDDEREKFINTEIYSTTSLVRITLYLRDLWFIANGWELPTDQEKWNSIRKNIKY